LDGTSSRQPSSIRTVNISAASFRSTTNPDRRRPKDQTS
jgi:hypothetical protein